MEFAKHCLVSAMTVARSGGINEREESNLLLVDRTKRSLPVRWHGGMISIIQNNSTFRKCLKDAERRLRLNHHYPELIGALRSTHDSMNTGMDRTTDYSFVLSQGNHDLPKIFCASDTISASTSGEYGDTEHPITMISKIRQSLSTRLFDNEEIIVLGDVTADRECITGYNDRVLLYLEPNGTISNSLPQVGNIEHILAVPGKDDSGQVEFVDTSCDEKEIKVEMAERWRNAISPGMLYMCLFFMLIIKSPPRTHL